MDHFAGADICLVSVQKETTMLFQQTVSVLPKPPLVLDTTLDSAEAAVRTAMADGCEIFVAIEHNARNLRKRLESTIVTIPVTDLDIAEALHQAKKQHGQPIALIRYHFRNERLSALREILDCEIKEFIFRDEEECRINLLKAGQEGCRAAVVGGPIPAFVNHEQPIPCASLLPAPANIILAVRQAEQILQVRQTERREAMKFKYVAQYAFTGIIVTDEQQKIIVFNPTAERIFGIKEGQALGRSMAQVIPQGHVLTGGSMDRAQLEDIKVLQQKNLIVNRIPILEGHDLFGVIYTFQDVSRIQSIEEKIRRASHTKGLTAKMTFQDVIGNSKTVVKTISSAKRFAITDETILITGESGTGKEMFAQSIHNESPRRNQPFVAINCAAIPSTLLESELFGYAEGAFTGARKGGKQGVFELAHHGTIFLDEISELPRVAQGHLLRVLQEKEVMRVGDGKVTPVDVRVVAATNQSLEDAVKQNAFRWDLYHRLNVLRLVLPPLREHQEDVLPVADALVDKSCCDQRLADQIKEVLKKYKTTLEVYPWPGNVRELQNLVKRMVALLQTSTGESIDKEVGDLLDETFSNILASMPITKSYVSANLKTMMSYLENELISQQYQESQGSKKDLAQKLGMNRTTLWRKLNKNGLQ
jgi:transcriptional regulator, propionate catabolism operon regulatory protein